MPHRMLRFPTVKVRTALSHSTIYLRIFAARFPPPCPSGAVPRCVVRPVDALAENGSAREAMQRDTLRLMARHLTEMVKKMPTLDWTQRESVRASLRRNVRRLLEKYGDPPDLDEDATQLVLRQAELSTENLE